MASKKPKLYCGFCRKSEDDMKMFFSGGETVICEKCVKVAFNARNDNETRALIKHHLLKKEN